MSDRPNGAGPGLHLRFDGRRVTSLYDNDVRLGFMIEHKRQWLVYDDRTPPPRGQHAPISAHGKEEDGRAALLALAPQNRSDPDE